MASKQPAITLRSLSIRNYRSIRNATLVPHKELSVLIGPNGAGKTNLLNAIRLLRPTQRYPRSNTRPARARITQLLAQFGVGKKTLDFRSEVAVAASDQKGDDQILVSEQWNLKGLGGNDAWLDIPRAVIDRRGRASEYYYYHSHDARGKLYKSRKARVAGLPLALLDTLSLVSKFQSSISYYSAARFTDPSQCPTSIELESEERPIETYLNRGPHFLFVSGLYLLSRTNRDLYSSFLAIVDRRGIGLIENIEWNKVTLPGGTVDIRAGGKIVRRKKSRTLIVPVISVGQSKLSFNQLSEGTLRALALLYYLLTDQSGLLLLEEPEVCIHHGLLNSIVAALKAHASHKQIIISTHSEFILDSVAPENVFVVRISPRAGTSVKGIVESLHGRQMAALRDYLANTGTLGEYWTHGRIE